MKKMNNHKESILSDENIILITESMKNAVKDFLVYKNNHLLSL